ncbi:MAG TPA: two-component regulator propeller domain-containing protein, partial [Puia sp.]
MLENITFRQYVIAAALILCIDLAAAGQTLLFRNLTIQQGLTQNSVIAITEDKHGFMWFGTRYGLSRYDGRRF